MRSIVLLSLTGSLAASSAAAVGHGGTAWSLGTEPDAIFLFLDDGDAAGHAHGFAPDIPGYVTEVASIDAQLGSILAAIERRPGFPGEDWQFVITSDHGGFGTSHGGVNPNSESIPFLVASQGVTAGFLANRVSN